MRLSSHENVNYPLNFVENVLVMPKSLKFEGGRNVEIKFQDLVGIKTAPGPGSIDSL